MATSGIDAGLRLAELCKALGHPARVTILRFLRSQRAGATCGDIVRQLPLAQSTVSQHLEALRIAGLIRGVPAAPRMIYHAEPAGLEALKREVTAL